MLRLCLLSLLPAAMAIAGTAQAQQWRIASEKDVSTSLKASPQTVADYLFGKYLDEKNRNIIRTFIKRENELIIWSDVLSTPMISERCYSMRFEKHTHANGEIRVRFMSLDYMGKKPKPDCIALRSRGEWVLTPSGSGTRLSYASLTDIGGRVPAGLARRSLSAAAISSVRKVAAGSAGLALPRGIGD